MVKLHTNDPFYKVVTVSMSGEVKALARLEPKMVSLRGKVGEAVAARVKIVPEAVPDFNITKAVAKNGRDIDFTIEKQQNGSDSYFLLTVRNKKDSPGMYYDTIVLETDTIPKRTIRVRVSGHLQS